MNVGHLYESTDILSSIINSSHVVYKCHDDNNVHTVNTQTNTHQTHLYMFSYKE